MNFQRNLRSEEASTNHPHPADGEGSVVGGRRYELVGKAIVSILRFRYRLHRAITSNRSAAIDTSTNPPLAPDRRWLTNSILPVATDRCDCPADDAMCEEMSPFGYW